MAQRPTAASQPVPPRGAAAFWWWPVPALRWESDQIPTLHVIPASLARLLKCSLGISSFLEEISSLSHFIVFLYFYALFT